MMTPSNTMALSVLIPWHETIRALQLPLNGTVLPQRTTCPLCHKKDALHIYHDSKSGGAWHQCSRCHISGDMLQLVIKAWGLKTDAALARLAGLGVQMPPDCHDPKKVASYLNRPCPAQSAAAAWEKARYRYPYSNAITVLRIRERFNLDIDISPDRWEKGPGQMLGALSRSDIESCFNPGFAKKMLPGRDWDNVICTPFYDLPGRISGFGLICRQGQMNDVIFRGIGPKPTDDAGLAFLPSVPLAGNPPRVFAVNSWMTALQFHMRHFKTSIYAMPLVAWHDGVNRTRSWSSLTGKKVIFWVEQEKIDYRVIMHAVESDGYITRGGPQGYTPANFYRYARRRSSEQTMAVIDREAIPWTRSLFGILKRAGEAEKLEMFNGLERAGADVSYILRQCGRYRCNRMLPYVPRTRIDVTLNRKHVVEQRDTWRLSDGDEILNCVPKIIDAIKDSQSQELFYFGTIRYAGKMIYFVERLEEVRDNTLNWLQRELMKHSLGIVIAHPAWRKYLHQIAVLFNEPKFNEDALWKWTKRLRNQPDKGSAPSDSTEKAPE